MARKDAAIEAIEEMLLEAWELSARQPDKERGWLASGSRSSMPQIVRDRMAGDYPDADRRARRGLNTREQTLVDQVFNVEDCLTREIAPMLRPLMGTVWAFRTRPDPGGFRWSSVWVALGGAESGVTSEALKQRYERVLVQLSKLSRVRAMADMWWRQG